MADQTLYYIIPPRTRLQKYQPDFSACPPKNWTDSQCVERVNLNSGLRPKVITSEKSLK